MLDILIDTALDALKMLPFLLLVYLVIEFVEHKALDRLCAAFSSERLGVVSAAALGLFPQCGFSVAAANLYSEHLITAGTLIAVFISTSDEAIPIISSHPESLGWLVWLLLVKFVYAVLIGFIVNLVFKLTKLDRAHSESHSHSKHIHESGVHHHCAECDSNSGIIINALKRTVSIFVFIFIIGLVLNGLIYFIGEERISSLLLTNSIAQPFVAALIGLIPNCAASVVLTELFISGTLSFASLCAGLCAGAGVGILVLFRVNHCMKQNFAILGLLYLSSALIGLVIQLVM
ncbi:MAG TPA: arsenic efflux protein [Firmicutes bacterium]|nr:arsenic efflux protein [Bacillota bacterium]